MYLLSLAATVLALGSWLAVRGVQAQDELVQARDELSQAREHLLDRDVAGARAAITSAGGHTRRARAATHDPVWWLAARLPRLGATPTAVRGLAQAADDLAREVLPVALETADGVDPARVRAPDGAVDLAVLQAATPAAATSADRAQEVLAALRSLTGSDVVDRVDDRRQELAEQTEELTDSLRGAARALDLAPVLLGADRPRRYLLLVQQTAESRGTGGIIGGYVEVEASQGRLRVLSQGSNSELRSGLVPPPPDVPQEFIDLYEEQEAFFYWQNANVSPNLPVVARVLESRWRAQGGAELDGVVMLDAVALEALLAGSEPLQLGDQQIPSDGIVEYLAVGQYRDFPPIDPTQLGGQQARKDQLEEVAAVAAARLAGGGGDTTSLLRGLTEAVRSGHLRMASDDPVLAPLLADAGVDGALPSGDRPLAYAVVNDSTTGKLDHFLQRRVVYRAGDCQGDVRSSTISVELLNDVPDEELPPYLTTRLVDGERVQTRSNQVVLSVYATPGARLEKVTLDGRSTAPTDPAGPFLVNLQEAGLPFWNLELELPPGQPRELVLHLVEPVVPGEALVPEQPLSRPLVREVDVPAC